MKVWSKLGGASGQDRGMARGFSLIELLIVVAIILIIAAIAIPNLQRARMAANEASAAESIRSVTTASVVYFTTYGNGYPPSLVAMSKGAGLATCDLSDLGDPVVSAVPNQKSGYTFAYTGQNVNATPGPACTNPGFAGYLVTAIPTTLGITGQRSFCSDTPGVIHFDPSGLAAGGIAACDALTPLN